VNVSQADVNVQMWAIYCQCTNVGDILSMYKCGRYTVNVQMWAMYCQTFWPLILEFRLGNSAGHYALPSDIHEMCRN
jgi:hypothetical protein